MHATDLLTYFLAWVGHAALWLVALNVFYSQPLNKYVLKITRLLAGVIIFGFPLAVVALIHWGVIDPTAKGHQAPIAIEVYLAVCLGMSCLIVPVVTAARLMRPAPPHLIARRSDVLDVARQLGRKPAGDGRYRRVALLPGNQVFQIEFSEVTLRLPGLPAAWDGLTILQLTDLHLTGTPERVFYDAALDRCMKLGTPDVVAITGDLIDTDRHHRWLMPILGRLRWKEAALAILGNHDYWHRPPRIRRRLERLGMVVLGNGWRTVTVRGEPLIAIGQEGPWFRPGPDLSDCPADGFRLCLSHTPDNIRWARSHGVRLMLSGHTHGGAIRLPLFGSLFVPSRFSRKYDCGLFWEPPTLLYVGRGIGGKEPIRYNCRPEITRLVLLKG